jgi:hypothetical protein
MKVLNFIDQKVIELKTKYGYFEFAEHISKKKQDILVAFLTDALNEAHAIGYKHGMEDKVAETNLTDSSNKYGIPNRSKT